MKRFLEAIRTSLQKIFFWHENGKRAPEQHPIHAHDHALVFQVSKPTHVSRWKQIRYSGLVFNAKEQRIILGAIGLFLVAIITAGWAIANDILIRVPARGGVITEAVIGSPLYLNPLYAATNDPDADLVALIYSGLFRRTNGTTVTPDLVERYEWSDDAKTLTLTLREYITFHDGEPLTSDDVIFTLRAAQDPAWRSTYVNAFRDATFERTDNRTISITLKEPDVNILDALTIGILPVHIWQDIAPQNALLADANTRPIGSGPFRVHSFRRNANGAILSYALERFDAFYGIQPFIDRFELRFFPDRSIAEEAVRGGQADMIAFVSSKNVEKLTKSDNLKSGLLELPQETIAFFNVTDAILKEKKVRQALAIAIERDDIIQAQSGNASPVNGPYPFTELAPTASSTEELLAYARTLLDEAGWKLPEGADIRVRSSSTTTTSSTSNGANELVLTISVPNVPDLTAVADSLARHWSLIGAKVIVDAQESSALIQKATNARNAQIVVWNVLLNPSLDQYPVWWSGETKENGLNISNLQDRNVDDAIKALRTVTSTDALDAGRLAVTEAITSRFPAAFLIRPAYGYIHNKRIQNVSTRLQIGTPSDRFIDLPNWYVRMEWKLK